MGEESHSQPRSEAATGLTGHHEVTPTGPIATNHMSAPSRIPAKSTYWESPDLVPEQ